MPWRSSGIVLVVNLFTTAVVAQAQPELPPAQAAERSYWGVEVSGSPTASIPGTSLGKILNDQGSVDVSLSAVEIGVIHGRTKGGEAGVELVYRKIQDGSTMGNLVPASCTAFAGTTPLCLPAFGTQYQIRNAGLFGVSVHKYTALTIGGLVQVGAVFAAGVAVVRGTAEGHTFDYQFQNSSRGVTVVPSETVADVPFSSILSLRSTMFIGKVEPTVAVIVAPGLKLRAGWGLNFPAFPSFTVGASYLIGAR